MEGETSLLLDVSIALGVALAGGWLATRIGLSSIVGYVMAGMIISPFTPGFVGDLDSLLVLADIGIVLLLFAAGVQFNFRDLLGAGPRVLTAASLQVVGVLFATLGIAEFTNWSRDDALYIGAAAAMTSSTVLVRLLEERGDLTSEHGRIALAWSIVQDLWAVILIVVLASLTAGQGGDNVAADVSWAAVRAIVFVLGILVVGLRIIPVVLNRVAEERSRELFFLAIAALAIGTALASDYAGLSLALGAFLAGIVVSESDLSHRVLGELLPVRDVFAVIFFASAGMLIDPNVIRDHWDWVLLATFITVVIKTVPSGLVIDRLGFGRSTTILATAGLVPASEFSFLLARSGLDGGAISEDVFGVILGATVLSIVISPALLGGAYRYVLRESKAAAVPDTPPPSRLGRRAVVVGYNTTGQLVAFVLSPRFDVHVVEQDSALARSASDHGLNVLEGNPTSPAILEHMDLLDTRVLIVALSDPFATRLLVERAREINPHLDIITTAASPDEAARLRRAGASETVSAESEVGYELVRYGLRRFGVSQQEALAIVQRLRGR